VMGIYVKERTAVTSRVRFLSREARALAKGNEQSVFPIPSEESKRLGFRIYVLPRLTLSPTPTTDSHATDTPQPSRACWPALSPDRRGPHTPSSTSRSSLAFSRQRDTIARTRAGDAPFPCAQAPWRPRAACRACRRSTRRCSRCVPGEPGAAPRRARAAPLTRSHAPRRTKKTKKNPQEPVPHVTAHPMPGNLLEYPF